MSDYLKEWLKAAGIRAIKTFAESAIAAIGVTAVMSDVDWAEVFGTALLAAILSLLTSLAGLPEVEEPTVEIDTLNINDVVPDEDDLAEEISEVADEVSEIAGSIDIELEDDEE